MIDLGHIDLDNTASLAPYSDKEEMYYINTMEWKYQEIISHRKECHIYETTIK